MRVSRLPLLAFALVTAVGLAPAESGARADAAPAPADLTVGTGSWSEPVEGLRGRLVLVQGRFLGESKIRETKVYLELAYAPDAVHEPIQLYFDNQLTCALRDLAGKVIPPHGVPGSGGRPGACWVTLPFDSVLRLRVNPYGFGRDQGLLIPMGMDNWAIKSDDHRDHFFSGTFTASAPANHGKKGVWQGKLMLGKMKLSVVEPPA
jgi:hypothetical protein